MDHGQQAIARHQYPCSYSLVPRLCQLRRVGFCLQSLEQDLWGTETGEDHRGTPVVSGEIHRYHFLDPGNERDLYRAVSGCMLLGSGWQLTNPACPIR